MPIYPHEGVEYHVNVQADHVQIMKRVRGGDWDIPHLSIPLEVLRQIEWDMLNESSAPAFSTFHNPNPQPGFPNSVCDVPNEDGTRRCGDYINHDGPHTWERVVISTPIIVQGVNPNWADTLKFNDKLEGTLEVSWDADGNVSSDFKPITTTSVVNKGVDVYTTAFEAGESSMWADVVIAFDTALGIDIGQLTGPTALCEKLKPYLLLAEEEWT